MSAWTNARRWHPVFQEGRFSGTILYRLTLNHTFPLFFPQSYFAGSEIPPINSSLLCGSQVLEKVSNDIDCASNGSR
jgi:hypothetical protein